MATRESALDHVSLDDLKKPAPGLAQSAEAGYLEAEILGRPCQDWSAVA
jgi:hypothetical protein